MNFKAHLEQEVFEILASHAQKNNLETYLVGGYVRNLLLNRPSKDIDVVTIGSESGIKLAESINKELGEESKIAVYKNFGTAMMRIKGFEVEFVAARKESYRGDSRKPEVETGTLEEDQKRRDFTINAMSISLNKKDFGELIDPFDGRVDLDQKIIRTPLEPDRTFSDDPLRMMRAIRFASQYGFDIEADTFEGIIRQKDRIKIISAERIIDELNNIILSNPPSYGFKLLYQAGLLDLIFPEMTNLVGIEMRDGKGHKDNFYHTLKVLDNLSTMTEDLWLRWAAILHDIAKPATKKFHPKAGWTFHGHEELGARMVPQIFRRLKLPLNEKMRYVKKLVRLHLRPIALVKETVTDSALRRLLSEAGEDIDDLMKLCRADITSKDGTKVVRYLKNFDLVEQKLKEVEDRDHIRNFQPVITGELIMNTFGIPEGREVGIIKAAIKEAILEGEIANNYEEAFQLMLNKGQAMGLKIAIKPD